MVVATLLASAALGLGAGAVFLHVGLRHARRPGTGAARRATLLFGLWWGGLALYTWAAALQSGAASLGFTPLPLFVAARYVTLGVIVAAIFGLNAYLAYLFTGRERLGLLGAAHAVFYMVAVHNITASHPLGVTVDAWRTDLAYAAPLQGPVFVAIVLLLTLPPVLGALAYFTLYFRLEDRAQRFRVAVVSWGILGWFGSSVLARLAEHDAWQVVTRLLLGSVVAVAILAAYQPPAWLRRRLRLEREKEGPPLPERLVAPRAR